ncbi:hypothetical protein ES702_06365 [subsurface metagenome]
MKKRLFCEYCGGRILDFQQKTMRDGMHEGCAKLKDEGKQPDDVENH